MDESKPNNISKQIVFDAYKQVKANRGSAGIDGVDDINKPKNIWEFYSGFILQYCL